MPRSHDEYIGQILQAIDSGDPVSQRSLARDLGIALGLTNVLVRGLVMRGLIRASRIRRHQVRYLLTPAGIAEKARTSRLALARAVGRYQDARHRVRQLFVAVSRTWPDDEVDKPIVFFGTGEIAEIGYVCLQETDLRLVAAFDDHGRARFFNVPVHPRGTAVTALSDLPRDIRVVVLSLGEREGIERDMAASGIALTMVHWI